MDLSNKTPVLLFFVACVCRVSGLQPANLQVKILDGEVIVHWDKPVDAPSDIHYNVQFGKYAGEWTTVGSCTKITKTFCILSHLIQDYGSTYKARVQLVAGDVSSGWTVIKKIIPSSSELQPPSFTLWATSTTLTIYIHQKHILRQLFPYGIIYTIYLEEKAQNKSTVAFLKDDIYDHERTKTFTSLHWGKEYCVTIKVEGKGSLSSSVSHQQCLVLPEQEWIIVAVVSLTVAGLFTISAVVILCYVKRPVKTPAVLNSPVSGWLPLSVGETTMEVVTDKGWFLSGPGAEVKHSTRVTDQDGFEEDRRPSTDSGVSVKSNSDRARMRPEYSGCGSLRGQDSICSSDIDYQIQDEGSVTHSTRKMDDSGVGLSCHSDASSLNLEEQDSGCVNKSEESYNSQNLSSVCNNVFKEKLPESQLVSVVSGYRANTSFCTCSGMSRCMWCHNQGNYRLQYNKQLQNNCNIVDSYRKRYCTNEQMDIVIMGRLETPTNVTFVPLGETFPMLTALSSLPLIEEGRDFNMNDMSLSLCDVKVE